MVEGSTSEGAAQYETKGVNITSDSFPTAVSDDYNMESNALATSARREPVTGQDRLREHVQTIIEHMGPNTPHLAQNTSSEADNEESIFETSVFSSVYKEERKQVKPRPKRGKTYSSDGSTRDISELSALVASEPKHNIVDVSTHVIPQSISHKCCACPACGAVPVMPVPAVAPYGCACGYAVRYTQMPPERVHISKHDEKRRWISKLLKKKESVEIPMELYKMDVMQPQDDHSPPRKLVFDLVEGVPKPEVQSIGINTCPATVSAYTQNSVVQRADGSQTKLQHYHNSMAQTSFHIHNSNNNIDETVTKRIYNDLQSMAAKQGGMKKKDTEYLLDSHHTSRVDVYYFDHGNSGYYQTTDRQPSVITEALAEKTENYTSKFWAELFGTVHIGFSFCTSFILQFFRFLLYSICRPLTVGILQLGSDYFLKPCLAVLFNAVIQPPLIFLYNIATSLRDLCDPIAEGIGYFLREIAFVLRAIRVIEIRKGNNVCHEKHKKQSCGASKCNVETECPRRKQETCDGKMIDILQ